MDKKALIIIDMLSDFVTGPLKNERAQRIIPNIADLLNYGRKNGWVIVFSNDAHKPGDPEERVWGAHAMYGTQGAKVIKELEPKKGDYVVNKQNYSGFHETDLDRILKENKVLEVIITGQHTHICVRHTSADAFARNYSIIIPEDCVESFTDKDHKEGLEYLKMCYGAKLTSSKDLLSK
jgi:nicotinamidase-related amidase